MEKDSRRDFLKKMGLAGFAMPMVSQFQNIKPSNKNAKKLGIALVGLGNYATNRVGVGLEQSNFWEVKGIVTGTPSKIPDWKKKWGIEDKNVFNYENFDKISKSKDIDVVYICLPNSMHREFTERAAKAGKHVICEKPMATSVEDARAMIKACEENNVKLAIGYRLHFEPFNLEIMKFGREKTFGDITFINSDFGFKIGDPTQWRLNKKLAGGGPLMDVGIYSIQATRYTTGEEPVSVSAQFGPVTDPSRFSEVEESVHYQLDFPSGVTMSGFTSYKTNVQRFNVACNDGWFELSPAFGYGPLKGKTSKGEMDLPIVQHQHAQMEGMGPLFMSDKPIPSHCSGEEGLKDMKILMAILESAENGGKKVML
ncbi:Predicted dehydrogenase [Spirosomataceae bacterium TFI 002]|nr:Predicted dehydrogenase [Spirosomataceae bacterium TFI 002]